MAAISRSQLLKELLPGLNALFGLEYGALAHTGKYRFCVRKISDPEIGWRVLTKVSAEQAALDAKEYDSSKFYNDIKDMPTEIAEALSLVLILQEAEHLENIGVKVDDTEFHVGYREGAK